jgi:hypothetical protein
MERIVLSNQEAEAMSAKENPIQKIIVKCWKGEDEGFKKRLLADPTAVLKAEGVPVPDGITLKVLEDTTQTRTLLIPLPPERLSDALLGGVWAGSRCRGGLGPDANSMHQLNAVFLMPYDR